MKTYVLTLAKTFPKGHSFQTLPTYFAENFSRRKGNFEFAKIHTIRTNYDRWEKIINEVNAGKAILSVRQWSGIPYRSKQEVLANLTKDDGVGIEMMWLDEDFCMIGGVLVPTDVVASNDGLTTPEWKEWFAKHDKKEELAVIHFTPFRYKR